MPGLASPRVANRKGWLRPFYHSDNKRPSTTGKEDQAALGLTSLNCTGKEVHKRLAD